MSVEFQNGFLCGMATKGMLRSRPQYEPILWNDEGVYSHFYIDFKSNMATFSQGMFNESIVIADTIQIMPSGIQRVAPSIYKISIDLSTCITGVSVVNKATSLLTYADGRKLPVFSSHFYLAGMTSYLRAGYGFDSCAFTDGFDPDAVELNISVDTSASSFSTDEIYENTNLSAMWQPASIVESGISVILT